ncbi:hypothetical protein CkP1_0234 [Citrobacter phage CkP1]|nr:hypothetical protein CkP1_0234 [Citrobacter phage CkP1]
MISDNKFEVQDFVNKCREFAQAVANKDPEAKVTLRPDPVNDGFIVSITKNCKTQHTGLSLTRDRRVKMTNIMGYPF